MNVDVSCQQKAVQRAIFLVNAATADAIFCKSTGWKYTCSFQERRCVSTNEHCKGIVETIDRRTQAQLSQRISSSEHRQVEVDSMPFFRSSSGSSASLLRPPPHQLTAQLLQLRRPGFPLFAEANVRAAAEHLSSVVLSSVLPETFTGESPPFALSCS